MADRMCPPAAMQAGFAASRPGARYLVLAHPTDETAIAVASLLRQRHRALAVEWRCPEELLCANWDHRVSAAGVKTEIRMADGSLLAGNAPSVIFNRINFVDPPQFRDAAIADRDYARMEMFALLLSWLVSPGCPVINRPAPNALAGSAYRPPMWHRLAQISGLATVGLMATSSTRRFPAGRTAVRRSDLTYTVADDLDGRPRLNDFGWFSEPIEAGRTSLLTIGGRVPEGAPASLAEPCHRLAQLADTDILRIDVVASADAPSGWAFAGADSCPHVTEPRSVLRIVHLLETVAAAHIAGAP
ncbi:MAG: hypothetical protein H0V72_12680 [Bradyrhizobium sp.]|nr:hypothetical protein [Bradyrhizobium sp.]